MHVDLGFSISLIRTEDSIMSIHNDSEPELEPKLELAARQYEKNWRKVKNEKRRKGKKRAKC